MRAYTTRRVDISSKLFFTTTFLVTSAWSSRCVTSTYTGWVNGGRSKITSEWFRGHLNATVDELYVIW